MCLFKWVSDHVCTCMTLCVCVWVCTGNRVGFKEDVAFEPLRYILLVSCASVFSWLHLDYFLNTPNCTLLETLQNSWTSDFSRWLPTSNQVRSLGFWTNASFKLSRAKERYIVFFFRDGYRGSDRTKCKLLSWFNDGNYQIDSSLCPKSL